MTILHSSFSSIFEIRVLEAHLLDFAGDLYGQEGRYEFLMRLRDELYYEDPAELFTQIARDSRRRGAFLPARKGRKTEPIWRNRNHSYVSFHS